MKKFLLLFVIATTFFACKEAASPKETAQSFIKALYSADRTTASGYVSSESKAVWDKTETLEQRSQSPEESFQFATLTETVDGKTATVKNEAIAIPLVKEEDGWKIVLTEDLLNDIRTREETLASLQKGWDALLKEYEARTTVAKDYIKYRKSLGTLSPKAAMLSALLDSSTAPKEWNRETLLSYLQQQERLSAAIDGALEPSQAANTDLTMNYFLQFSNVGDRIKAAEAGYQAVAEKAHSPLYVPLPAKANTLQVKAD